MHYTITYTPMSNFSDEREIIYDCEDDKGCLRKVLAQIINISDDPRIRPSSKLSEDRIAEITEGLSVSDMRTILDQDNDDAYAYVDMIECEDGRIIYHYN